MLPASVYLGWVLAGLAVFVACRGYGPGKNRIVTSLITTVVLSLTVKIAYPDGLIGVDVATPMMAAEPEPDPPVAIPLQVHPSDLVTLTAIKVYRETFDEQVKQRLSEGPHAGL